MGGTISYSIAALVALCAASFVFGYVMEMFGKCAGL
jgi:hypothetical protein